MYIRKIRAAAAEPITRGTCGNCSGSGIFRGGGRVENGVYIGFQGPCYRCQGKGYQTPQDRNRNRTYDRHRIVHLG